MNKIICDICGTTYPETADSCPICGYSHDEMDGQMTEDVLLNDGLDIQPGFTPAKKREIFDFDEVNADTEDETDYEEESYDEDDYDEDDYEEEDYEDDGEVYDEEEEEEAPRHNTLLVILLTVLIAGLLIAAGFIFVRYFLPNMKQEDSVPMETTAAVMAVETESASIPCETLIISSGTVAELNEQGQHFLLHIKAMPENTTDPILYTSADESIATVTSDGKITAVSEGETTIYISCGKSSIECPVIVRYVEETVPATTEVITAEETLPVVEAVDPEATEAAHIRTDVVLKLKKTDIMLGVYYQFTLELDCDLQQNEVQWSSEHPHIATVDENGVVTAVKSGTTAITAKYGDQEVTCMVRCG